MESKLDRNKETVRVFISYSHGSPKHMERVLGLANKLRQHGVDCVIDQYESLPSDGWPKWTLRQMEEAQFILMVCTRQYIERFLGTVEGGQGKGVRWEGAIITQELYDGGDLAKKLVCLTVEEKDAPRLPPILGGIQRHSPFNDKGFNDLYRLLTRQPEVIKPDLGQVVPMPPKEVKTTFAHPETPGDGGEKNGRRNVWFLGRIFPFLFRAPLRTLAGATLAIPSLVLAAAYFSTPSYEVLCSNFETIPYALFNSMKTREYIYWLRLNVKNNMSRPLHVQVRCTVEGPDDRNMAKCRPTVASYTVEPPRWFWCRLWNCGRDGKKLDPGLQIVTDDFHEPLKLILTLKILEEPPETGILPQYASLEPATAWAGDIMLKPLSTKYIKVLIEPRSRFYFDLADSNEKKAPPEYLLASLAAWKMIDIPRDSVGLDETYNSVEDFMRSAYQALFSGSDALIRVSGTIADFPPKPYQEIRIASLLLQTRAGVTPLEAALLMATLGGDRLDRLGGRLSLIWAGPPKPALLLVWKESGTWRGIDLAQTRLDFQTNLNQTLKSIPAYLGLQVQNKLDREGVFLAPENRFGVVDFKQAAKLNDIASLP